MFHLFKEDKLTLQYTIITLFYLYVAERIMNFLNNMWSDKKTYDKTNNQSRLNYILKTFVSLYRKYFRFGIYAAIIVLKLAEPYIKPPVRFMWIYQLAYAFLGFVVFGVVWVYSNLKLYCWYKLEIKTQNEKIKKILGKTE